MQRYRPRGSTAVITGAAGGIGAELALGLAQRGSDLALVDRDAGGLDAVAARVRSIDPELTVTTHLVDLAERSDHSDLAAAVRAVHPRIGLLVNNAGVALGGRVEDISLDDLDWILTVNLRAPIALVKALLPDLRARGGAHIVNVSSLFGLIAPAGQAAYATSKFALRGFTLALQAELIPEGIGVTVVHPGGIATGIARNARLGAGLQGRPGAAQAALAEIGGHLTMPAEAAAALIIRAVERREERLVITRQAIVADRLARLMPVRQRGIIARNLRSAR